MASKSLSGMERAFVTSYLEDVTHNATSAAIKAGYSKKTAQEQSSRLLKKPPIKTEIERRLKEIEEKSDVSVQYVLKNLKEIVERCMTHEKVMEFDHAAKEMVQKQVADMESGKWVGLYEFDSAGANKALELIGRHLKMFTDKVQVDFTESAFERLERARQNAKQES